MDHRLTGIFQDFISDNSTSSKGTILSSYEGPIHVHWDNDEKVSAYGSLSFFIDFLKTSGLFSALVSDCPLGYTSNNKSSTRDILGTIVLSLLSGHRRYSHITSIRHDRVNPDLLGMQRVCSEDTVRRFLSRLDEDKALTWISDHLHYCYRPLLSQEWILDIDATVKPLYGQQEGAVVGYNPKKPGRPSHSYHSYLIANLRLVLGVDVLPGNQSHSCHASSRLFTFLDDLPKDQRPSFLRGDIDYGTNTIMNEAEARDLGYLFKLRCTKKVRSLIQRTMQKKEWEYAGQGWEGQKASLQLTGWNKERAVVVLRRVIKDSNLGMLEQETPDEQASFSFMYTTRKKTLYEYAVLVSSLQEEVMSIAQLYRDRADCENVFDELKNQWGWSGFTTKDLSRCRIMANLNALVYNWWSLFTRLCIADKRHEAITSRPMLMSSVAKKTTHARKTSITLTTSHGMSKKIQQTLHKAAAFLQRIRASAEQLSKEDVWMYILSAAMRHFLNGKLLKPPTKAIQSA